MDRYGGSDTPACDSRGLISVRETGEVQSKGLLLQILEIEIEGVLKRREVHDPVLCTILTLRHPA
jgi:hypothetical protein